MTGVRAEPDGCVVECDGAEPIRGDRVLVAVGRSPVTTNAGLESVGIPSDEQGRIAVDEHFATAVDGIYAVGDVVRGPTLAKMRERQAAAR